MADHFPPVVGKQLTEHPGNLTRDAIEVVAKSFVILGLSENPRTIMIGAHVDLIIRAY